MDPMDTIQLPSIELRNDSGGNFGAFFAGACAFFPAGAAVIAAADDQGKLFATVASRFMMISADPAVLAVWIEDGPAAAALARQGGDFSFNLLNKDQVRLARTISKKESDPLEGVPWKPARSGLPLLERVPVALLCRVSNATRAGGGHLLTCEVSDLTINGGEALVAWRDGFYRLDTSCPQVESEAALEQFMDEWVNGRLPRSRWNHAAHITVIAYYVLAHDADRAFELMKAGIRHYNTCIGIDNSASDGYHETLTMFWTNVVGDFVRRHSFPSRLEAVRNAVAVFGADRRHYDLYYSFDVKRDRRARLEVVPPDRQPPWVGSGS